MSIQTTGYPGFEEYRLIDLDETFKPVFHRGARIEMLENNQYNWWQDYFCSDQYTRPIGKNVAFLQPCTWSKPYDFSKIGSDFKKITDSYNNVHRIIVSNSGVIPFEYQLNPTFCSYDWNMLFESDNKKRHFLRNQYQEITMRRIINFFKSNHYDALIHVGFPVKQGLSIAINNMCSELGMKFYYGPSVQLYKKYREKIISLGDSGNFFTFPEVHSELEKLTKRVSELY